MSRKGVNAASNYRKGDLAKSFHGNTFFSAWSGHGAAFEQLFDRHRPYLKSEQIVVSVPTLTSTRTAIRNWLMSFERCFRRSK